MLGVASIAVAQSSSLSSGGGGGSPIDGGVTIMVAGIALYGAKKIRDNHKKTQDKKDI